MNGYANVLLTTLLAWMQGMARSLWQLISGQEDNLLALIADNWVILTVLLCAVGLIIDTVVYLVRWRPYLVWASFFRRMARHKQQEEARPVRQWVYADGSARTEQVEAEEAPEAAPMVVPLPVTSAPEQAVQAAEPELAPVPPVLSEEPVVMPVRQRRTQRHRAVQGAGRRIAQLLAPPDDEDELPRYHAPQMPVEKEQAYHAPYIPPQWKRPGDPNEPGGAPTQHGG